MARQDILNEVTNGKWQPQFEFTDDLDAVVDSILKPHEDYFLGLHSKVKDIIEREIEFAKPLSSFLKESSYGINGKKGWEIQQDLKNNYKIIFADVCNWQKELFEYKKSIIQEYYNELNDDLSIDGAMRLSSKIRMIESLPNQHINLGLRTTNVKVGDWNPPHPMFLEDLKEMCFPIKIDEVDLSWWNYRTAKEKCTLFYFEKDVLNSLTEWYKTLEVCHYFCDLNGRLGGIVINILSYILTGKYLIRKHD
jgi:hypothetical protein